MAVTQAALDKARSEGFVEARNRAILIAEQERAKAQKELNYADATKNFNPSTVGSSKVRRETAKRIAAAIRKLKA
jgi:hypothetical protein